MQSEIYQPRLFSGCQAAESESGSKRRKGSASTGLERERRFLVLIALTLVETASMLRHASARPTANRIPFKSLIRVGASLLLLLALVQYTRTSK